MWDLVKSNVVKTNLTFKVLDVQKIMQDSLKKATLENWRKAAEKLIKFEKAYCKVHFGDANAQLLIHWTPKLPPYRTQSIDLLCKTTDSFLYDGNFGV